MKRTDICTKFIHPSAEIVNAPARELILDKLNEFGRVCYKSNMPDTTEQKENFIRQLLDNGHHSVLEHISISVRFIIDRGLSHEIVRHRIASYSQESTRYCNYTQDRFQNEVQYIIPRTLELIEDKEPLQIWEKSMVEATQAYFDLLDKGIKPEIARNVLPTSLKTELVMTANLREWLHYFQLRLVGVTGKPHPELVMINSKLLEEFKKAAPVVFDNITD